MQRNLKGDITTGKAYLSAMHPSSLSQSLTFLKHLNHMDHHHVIDLFRKLYFSKVHHIYDRPLSCWWMKLAVCTGLSTKDARRIFFLWPNFPRLHKNPASYMFGLWNQNLEPHVIIWSRLRSCHFFQVQNQLFWSIHVWMLF